MTITDDKVSDIIRALGQSELSGGQLCETTKIDVIDLYPRLVVMEKNGLIASRWEDGTYPRRRLYRLIA